MTTFEGFAADAIGLLAQLPDFTRDDYAARKPEIVEQLQDPAKAFVEAIVPELQESVSAGLTGTPKINGSISPLNNDLRFAPAGTPLYKDHLLLWFWEGASKKGAPTLAVRIHPEGVGFGGGMGFDKDQLEAWRAAVHGRAGDRIEQMVSALSKHDAEVAGETLKRVPKPFDQGHAHADLLRHKSIQVRWQEPVPASFTSARFTSWCLTRLKRLEPLHRVLVDEVVR